MQWKFSQLVVGFLADYLNLRTIIHLEHSFLFVELYAPEPRIPGVAGVTVSRNVASICAP